MNNRQRKVRVRPIRRKDPDLRRLARALIELAITQNEIMEPESKRRAA